MCTMLGIVCFIVWDVSPEIFSWNLPFLQRPILWYGGFFALGTFLSYLSCLLMARCFLGESWEKNSAKIEYLGQALVVVSIVSARLFHVFFYQGVASFLQDPWHVLRIWEGGTASHGGILGASIFLLAFRKKIELAIPGVTIAKLADALSIPTCIVVVFVRIGNFFNQEIVGTPTDVPWGVLFLGQMDPVPLVPRHPVQLYEAAWYLALGLFLVYCVSKGWHKKECFISSVFFVCFFGGRIFLECFKENTSTILGIRTGQVFSILFLFVGLLWFLVQRNKQKEGVVS